MKLNIKNLCLLLIGALCFGLFIGDWLTALFFNGTFTWYGLMINGIEAFTIMMVEAELTNYYDKKNEEL